MKRLGLGRPFLSAVELRDTLTNKGLPPLRCAIEVTSVAKAQKWPFHDIRQVVHDFPLPDYSSLLDIVAHAIAPLPHRAQLEVLGKSLSLCFHAASEEGAPNPEMRQVVIDLIGSLSMALGKTCSTGAPPLGPPSTPPTPTWDDASATPHDEDDTLLMVAPHSKEPAPPAAPEASAEGALPAPAPKKGKGRGKAKPPTTVAPTPPA